MPHYNGAVGDVLFYDLFGPETAPPLILLAGGAGAHPRYLGDLAGLSEQYQLVRPHLRGVGRSSDADLVDVPSDVPDAGRQPNGGAVFRRRDVGIPRGTGHQQRRDVPCVATGRCAARLREVGRNGSVVR